MKRIAIIGASSLQNPLILKAKAMGFETHVFAWECGDIGEKTADVFHPISIIEKEAITEECRKADICAIASIASDLAVLTVNYVSRAMGFKCNDIFSDLAATNKYLMRQALKSYGIKTPWFKKVTSGDDLNGLYLHYPLIVKPTDRSGSRGVSKVENRDELEHALERAISYSFEHAAIVEGFIEGEEFSCETISFNGEHTTLALTKKYTTGSPNFIETGHKEPADFNSEETLNITNQIHRALDALKITHSASHAEFRVDANGDICIIEIGARMGGDCIGSDLVMLSTGYDFVRMVIDVACNNAPVFTKVCEPKTAFVRYILNDADYEEYHEIKRLNKLNIVKEVIEKAPNGNVAMDSSERFGYYVYTV